MIPISKTAKLEAECANFCKACIDELGDTNLSVLDNYFMTTVGKNFSDVISLPYEELVVIVESFGKIASTDTRFKLLVDLYKKISDTKKTIGINKFSVIDLVVATDLKVCPYCNRNYITTIKSDSKIKIRTAQIDHFWNKADYPYLAICFYNLIPSCSYCNLKKSNREIKISPYNSSYNFQTAFKFSHSEIPYIPYDSKMIEIELEDIENDFNSNCKVFGISELYKTHKNIVYSTYVKNHIYSKTRIEEIMKDFPSLFQSIEELEKFILDFPVDESEFQDHPLSKLKYDLLKKYNRR